MILKIQLFLHATRKYIVASVVCENLLYHGALADQRLPPVLQIICYPVKNWLWHCYVAIIPATN